MSLKYLRTASSRPLSDVVLLHPVSVGLISWLWLALRTSTNSSSPHYSSTTTTQPLRLVWSWTRSALELTKSFATSTKSHTVGQPSVRRQSMPREDYLPFICGCECCMKGIVSPVVSTTVRMPRRQTWKNTAILNGRRQVSETRTLYHIKNAPTIRGVPLATHHAFEVETPNPFYYVSNKPP